MWGAWVACLPCIAALQGSVQNVTENWCLVRQLFFGLMALAMVGVRYKSDKRDQYLQHGGWFVKIALWLLFNVLAFFLPVGLVSAYGACGPCPIHLSQFSPSSPGCPAAQLQHYRVC